jgi:hypothetical protein
MNTFGGQDHEELQVLCSAAGYYIGTLCLESDGHYYPNSRDSVKYWQTRQEAQKALDDKTFEVRGWA